MVDGSCTPCEEYKITDPKNNTRCIDPDCPEGKSALANGTCQNTSEILEDLNIVPAPLFKDQLEPIQILVNPLKEFREFIFNVADQVDLNSNQLEELSFSVVSGLNETLMTWDEKSKNIRFIDLGEE